jgi:deaminated glutathione amidase
VSRRLKAACIQFTAGREIGPNVERLLPLMRRARAAGADLIALPENATMIEPIAAQSIAKALPEESHSALPAFSALARETGAWILTGSLTIKLDGNKVANRSLLLDAAGTVVARYDKLHLFDVTLRNGEAYRESDTVRPGTRAVLAPTPWGLIGMTICYDLRFPELYRRLAQAGASFITIPSAFTRQTGGAHWHVLLRARAIETGCYVLAPAQCGIHAENRKTFGHSLIVDPWGEVLADGGEEEGFVMAELDTAKVEEARRMIPSLQHERPYEGPARPTVAGKAAS